MANFGHASTVCPPRRGTELMPVSGRRVTETVAAIVAAHRAGTLSPAQTVARSFARIRDHNDPAVFISLRDEQDALAEARSARRAKMPRSFRSTAFRLR